MTNPAEAGDEIAIVVGATAAFGSAIVERLAAAALQGLAVARSVAPLAALQERGPRWFFRGGRISMTICGPAPQ